LRLLTPYNSIAYPSRLPCNKSSRIQPVAREPGPTASRIGPTALNDFFPKDLPQLEEFLSTSDPNVDPEDGHPLAYEAILRECQKFEITPLFLKE
jgi:hypothetical protein